MTREELLPPTAIYSLVDILVLELKNEVSKKAGDLSIDDFAEVEEFLEKEIRARLSLVPIMPYEEIIKTVKGKINIDQIIEKVKDDE